MKVKELRKKLKKMDGELEVEFRYFDASYGETYESVDEVWRKAERYSIKGNTPAKVVLN